jgi:protein subunit release factor B
VNARIEERLLRLRLSAEDFTESFVRSSGAGGQNVNKVSTCVMLVHQPTGLSVKAMQHRTQVQNREAAWLRLLDKIEAEKQRKRAVVLAERELRKRQNRKRPRGVKERMLEGKRQRSEIKRWRSKPSD